MATTAGQGDSEKSLAHEIDLVVHNIANHLFLVSAAILPESDRQTTIRESHTDATTNKVAVFVLHGDSSVNVHHFPRGGEDHDLNEGAGTTGSPSFIGAWYG